MHTNFSLRLVFPSPFKARSFLSHVQTALQPRPPSDYANIFAFVYRAYRKDLKWEVGRNKGVGLVVEQQPGGGERSVISRDGGLKSLKGRMMIGYLVF